MTDTTRGNLERCDSCRYYKCVCAPPTLDDLKSKLAAAREKLSKLDLIGPSELYEKVTKSCITDTWSKDRFKSEGSKVIETSSLGELRIAYNTKNCGWFALRRIDKLQCERENQVQHIKTEIAVLRAVHPIRHPFLKACIAEIVSPSSVHMVMEYVPGGTLHEYLRRRRERLGEDQAKFYISQFILAVEALHAMGVVHRNIKPESAYLTKDGYLKLGGLNMCKIIRPPERTYTLCGPLEYMAPEVSQGLGYTMAADWWMIGVTLYELIHRCLPFVSNQVDCASFLSFNTEQMNLIRPFGLSNPMWDIIRQLLNPDPTKRLGGMNGQDANALRSHRWFRFYATEAFSWNKLLAKQYKAFYKPVLLSECDTSHYGAQPAFTVISSITRGNAEGLEKEGKRRRRGRMGSAIALSMKVSVKQQQQQQQQTNQSTKKLRDWRKPSVLETVGAGHVKRHGRNIFF